MALVLDITPLVNLRREIDEGDSHFIFVLILEIFAFIITIGVAHLAILIPMGLSLTAQWIMFFGGTRRFIKARNRVFGISLIFLFFFYPRDHRRVDVRKILLLLELDDCGGACHGNADL